MNASDADVFPWSMGCGNGQHAKPWLVSLEPDFDRLEGWFCFIAQWDKQRFDEGWESDIVEPVQAYHQEWLDWIDRLDGHDPVESVAGNLNGRQPAIFRFLASKPKGVTFQEFFDYREPSTQKPLTQSLNDANVERMLRRLSGELEKYKFEIFVSIPKNQIVLNKIRKHPKT